MYALRRLAEIEFSGPPSLAQLGHVCVPFEDVGLVDEAMLCRFLVPRPGSALLSARPARPARTWTQWLGHAGLLTDGVRTSMGTATTATYGHLCRSLFERHVDDFLHHWGVAHEPEPAYPRHPELNTTGLRADWRLADGTLGVRGEGRAQAGTGPSPRPAARHGHGRRPGPPPGGLRGLASRGLGRLRPGEPVPVRPPRRSIRSHCPGPEY